MQKQYESSGMISRLRQVTMLLAFAVLLVGCAKSKELEKKLRDVEFSVVAEEQIPTELKEAMEEQKEKEFQLTYQTKEYLYLAKGYGSKPTSGYSVSVEDLYLTETYLVMDTEITGPGEGEKVGETTTWPSVVIKTEMIDKSVIFR